MRHQRRRLVGVLARRGGLAAAIIALSVHFAAFAAAPTPSLDSLRGADASLVVFTGDMGRIAAALDLLQAGVGDRLLVSGANPNAGIWVERFAKEFGGEDPARRKLIACCVDLGERADTTLQNALETACWARAHGVRRLVLVTSDWHMPRAAAALRAAVPETEITPYPVAEIPAENLADLDRRSREFVKHLIAQTLLRGPTRAGYGAFAAGCPA